MSVWVFPGSTVVRVVDGDTFHASVSRTLDAGFHVIIDAGSVQKFRLNGCNAAPLSTDSGAGAAAALGALLALGNLTITSLAPYKYGDEWMASVTLPDGRDVTTEMITAQWAAPWNGQGPQPLPPWPRTVL
jgi:endonuclease YncB( thermonuclease family)